MRVSIVTEDGTLQVYGESTETEGGVVVANTLFRVPPFQIVNTPPPSRWATWENGNWADHPPPPKTPEQLAEEARQQAAEAAKAELFSDTLSKMTYAEIRTHMAGLGLPAPVEGTLTKMAVVLKALAER